MDTGNSRTHSLSSHNENDKELSLSEGGALERSNEMLPGSGSLKKRRKFKPGKFLSKRLKSKKEDRKLTESEERIDSENTQSEIDQAKDSSMEKRGSLKNLKNSLVKRFSAKRIYKSDRVQSSSDFKYSTDDLKSLSTDDLDDNEEVEKKIDFSQTTPIASYENKKKVQLKILISGKKMQKLSTSSYEINENVIDKASPSLQSRADIILPSTSTTVGGITAREEFFNVISPQNSANLQANTENNFSTAVSSPSSMVKEGFNSKISASEKFLALPLSANKSSDNVNREKSSQDFAELKINEEWNNKKSVGVGIKKEIINNQRLSDSLKSLNEEIQTFRKEIDVKNDQYYSSSEKREKRLTVTERIKFFSEKEKRNLDLKKIEEKNLNTDGFLKQEDTVSVDQNKKEIVKSVVDIQEPRISDNSTHTSFTSETEIEFQKLVIAEEQDSEKSNEVMRKGSIKSKIPINVRRFSDSGENDLTTVRTQEAHQPYHLNLSKPTISEASSSEIKFEVGTPVRPQRTLSATNSNFSPLPLIEIQTPNVNVNNEADEDVFHTPKSEASDGKWESFTRRKIAYIPQLTFYTAEEQELLKSNIMANSDSFDMSLPPDSSIFPMFDSNALGSMSPITSEKREHLYKILVIGELGTGKTSFIKRYVHQFFSQNYRATIGVDFALKVLNWDQSTIIRLQLWDIAGQERFGNMTRVYYKEAVGAFIVFDVTRDSTFAAVSKWKQDLDSKVQLPDGNPIPCVLLANKCDQSKQGLVSIPAKMDEYCKQNGFIGWFETSAKENTNIDESAKTLVNRILLNDKLINNDMVDGDRLVLNAEENLKQKKVCSC